MSRNSKNARLQKLEEAMPKNRSAAARERRANGEQRKPGRAAAPKHDKKRAWWQMIPRVSYAQWIKGGGKAARRSSTSNEEVAADGAAG